MSERRFTLLELHLHNHGDLQVGPEGRSSGGRTSLTDRLRRRTGGASADTLRRRVSDIGAGSGRSIPLQAIAVVLLVIAGWLTLRER